MTITQLRQVARCIRVAPSVVLAQADKHAAALSQRGVTVTDVKPTDAGAILIGLGFLVALIAAGGK